MRQSQYNEFYGWGSIPTGPEFMLSKPSLEPPNIRLLYRLKNKLGWHWGTKTISEKQTGFGACGEVLLARIVEHSITLILPVTQSSCEILLRQFQAALRLMETQSLEL